MDDGGDQPRLRLIERSGDQPSRIVVTPLRSGGLGWAWSRMLRRGLALAARLGNTARMPAPAALDELLSYAPNRDKIMEGVLFLLEQALQRGFSVTADTLTTVMFLTDKGHLDAYGRPVFFDNYVATAEGPAGVAAGEMLDPGFDWSSFGMEVAPWTLGADNDGRPAGTRGPNLRRLSATDVEALSSALATAASLDAEQLRLFTHRNGAYASAWANGAGDGTRLDPRLVPERRDDGMIDDLIYASRHAFVAPRRA